MSEPGRVFKSYGTIRQELDEISRVANEEKERDYRNKLVQKISTILDRMVSQEKVEDFIELPAASLLPDPKQEAMQAKVLTELRAELEISGWIITSPTGKGFGVKRK